MRHFCGACFALPPYAATNRFNNGLSIQRQA